MGQKNFKTNEAINKFFTDDVQAPKTTQEEREAQQSFQTQGRRGYKMQRINMAFTPDNMEYIRVFSKLKGLSMTAFVNEILDKNREKNKDKIDKIKELLED